MCDGKNKYRQILIEGISEENNFVRDRFLYFLHLSTAIGMLGDYQIM
jgi:hypothetical protein